MSSPSLSVCCFSGDPLGRTAAILGLFREVADEVVCAVDASVGEGDLDYVLPVADRVVRCEFDRSTGIERHLAWLHDLCRGRWILRIDSDEVPSTALLAALGDAARTDDVLSTLIERRWLWPDEHHYLHEAPWRFDWQVRLVRNDPTLVRFPGEMHSSADPTPPFRYVDAPLYHLNCVVNDLGARERTADLYEAERPGHVTDRGFPVNGFYFPERYARFPTASVPDEDAALIAQVLAAPTEPRPGTPTTDVPLVRLAEVDRRWARRRLPDSAYRARIEPLEPLSSVAPDQSLAIAVRVHNDGTEVWPWGEFPPYVHLGDRWYPVDDPGTCVEGVRTGFTVDIGPGTSEIQMCDLRAPTTAGEYVLELDIVHELVRWFDAGVRLSVTVEEGPGSSEQPEEDQVEARAETARTEPAIGRLEAQLSDAGDRARRLEEELAAFRARRSVRAADALSRAARAGRRLLRSEGLRARLGTVPLVPRPPSSTFPRSSGGGGDAAAANTAKWEGWYAGVETPRPYGDTSTYRKGAEFLSDCGTVEDWGCGLGWMRNFVPADRYVGVDGSASRFADRVVDLETYRSDVDGVFMRHVLEHNYRWEKILENALASFRHRFVLVTFTPYTETTREIAFNEDPGVPDISFAKEDLTRHFVGLSWREETFATDTQYGTETIYFVERRAEPTAEDGQALSRRRSPRAEVPPAASDGGALADLGPSGGQARAARAEERRRLTPLVLRISAVVPCYNGSAYLEEALSSIASQTRAADEVVVVDDGSTDGSAELAERWGATVVRHGVNRGEGAARNTGWRAAAGDAVAWLDADDSWRPRHLEVVAALLERHPEVGCAYGAVQRFGLDDQVFLGPIPVGEPREVLRDAFWSWIHPCIGCIVRRDALEAIGGYDERGRISVDFDLWLRLARRCSFVATDEVTANWRWHEAQQSAAPLGQILAVHRYRRRFLDTLRKDGEDALADELEALVEPAWRNHLNGVKATVEQRMQRAAESLGQPYRGPTRLQQATWAALSRVHPSALGLAWHLAGRA